MVGVFLVENEVFHELEGIHENILQVYMLRCIFLVSYLLERNRLMSEGAKAGLLTRAVLGVLGDELPFIA